MASDTRQQILDTAERLFAFGGIDAVSLRTITAEAGVNLAAVHYHFGSKEALVKEVFRRRIGALNEQRLAMLDEYEVRAGEGRLPVEEVLRSLIEPAIRLMQDKRGEVFVQLCGRIHTESADYLQRFFDELFTEVLRRFSAAFQRALPELPPGEMFWRAYFVVGMMVHTMRDAERLRRFSGGLCDPTDVEGMIERMVKFAAAGMRAPLSADVAQDSAMPVAAEGRA